MSDIVETFDRECATRKITLSRETRAVCIAVLKAVVVDLEGTPTPVDGTPVIRGRRLTPAEQAAVEAEVRKYRNLPTEAPVIAEDVRGYGSYPCHARPFAEWCDNKGPGGFMGHTCIVKTNPHASYDPGRDI